MAGVADHVHALLNAAPELIHTPGLTTGLAIGLTAPQSGPVDGREVGPAAVLAQWALGIKQYAEDMAREHGGA